MKILEVKEVTHRFPNGTEAVKKVTFEVNEGELLVISGKNGSGKSVLMHHLNGLYKPTSGSILFRGKSIFKNLSRTRQKIGLVFQNSDSQIVSQTVGMDIAFGPENLNLDKEEVEKRVETALKIVGLTEKRNHYTHSLSGGEKKKLAIAGILAMNPEIIILDEPFSNLDYPGVRQILRQILDLHKSGHTVICITHELDKILFHADRLIIMKEGEIVCDGSPEETIIEASRYDIRIPGNPGNENPIEILKRMTWLE